MHLARSRIAEMNEKERIASEATRLLNEPLLVEALDTIMGEAFAEFKAMKVTPDNLHEIIALQQRILVVQDIPALIEAKIKAAGLMDGGMTVESKPTA